MKRAACLLALLLVAGACSSTTPERPEVPRPDGVEPEGLADMRDTLADQREEARAQEAAISGAPTGPPELTFIESIFAPVGNALSSVRNFIFGAPAPGARAQAPR